MENDPKVGVAGGMVYFYSTDKKIYSAGGFLDLRNGRVRVLAFGERDVGQYVKRFEVHWVAGCSILVRRDIVEKMGCLDEGYVFYRDEVDLCQRSHILGYRVMSVPDAIVWHKVSTTITKLGLKFYYLYRAWIRFVVIHVDRRYLPLAVLSVVLITLAKSIEAFLKGDRLVLQQAFGAIWWNVTSLPFTLQARMNRVRLGIAQLR
jgi:GT2 family glycosyltransferase